MIPNFIISFPQDISAEEYNAVFDKLQSMGYNWRSSHRADDHNLKAKYLPKFTADKTSEEYRLLSCRDDEAEEKTLGLGKTTSYPTWPMIDALDFINDMDIDDVFDKLNESNDDDFEWAKESLEKDFVVTKEDLYVGLKVKRGPNWEFGNQDEGADYGLVMFSDLKYTCSVPPFIEEQINDPDFRSNYFGQKIEVGNRGDDDPYWAVVLWVKEIKKKGKLKYEILHDNCYRVGDKFFDLSSDI